jgi:hypothetical protein
MKTVMILKVRFEYTSLDTMNVFISWANIYEYGYSVSEFGREHQVVVTYDK